MYIEAKLDVEKKTFLIKGKGDFFLRLQNKKNTYVEK